MSSTESATTSRSCAGSPPCMRNSHRRTILLVISDLRGGGAERALSSLANHWSSHGIGVTFITLGSPDAEDFYALSKDVIRETVHVPVSRWRIGNAIGLMRRVLVLRRLISTARPCCVLSFLTENNILTLAATRGLALRTIVAERTHPAHHQPSLLFRVLRFLLYPTADAVAVQTMDIAAWVNRHLPGSKVVVIPNHLAVSPLPPQPRRSTLLYVGRLCEEKQVSNLLAAFAAISHQFPSWMIEIAGTGPDENELRHLAARLGIDGQTRFLGQQRDVAALMCESGVFVLPSKYEGFPNALLEAMSAGMPVIASSAAGNMLICDGLNGLLYCSGNVEQLAERMTQMMESEALRSRLGEEARKARDSFHIDRIAAAWEELMLQPVTPATLA